MTRYRRRLMEIAAAVAVVAVLMTFGLTLLSWRSSALGLMNGRLSPCPDSPNCVCSQDADDRHAIEPFAVGDDGAAVMDRLRTVLDQHPRARIITNKGDYLHAEFTTPLLRFVDDVEFLLDENGGVIHVRSASRVGHSDFGANRKRVESIRNALTPAAK